MTLLLDTHAILWWWAFPDKLSQKARASIEHRENDIWVSSVSAYEISLKQHFNKLEIPQSLIENFEYHVRGEGWTLLPLTCPHAILAGQLETDHKDPFDRLIAAQSIVENVKIVTCDQQISRIQNIDVVW